MLTKIDFIRIIASMKPGNIYRVRVNSTKEFNSQRMILYRVISGLNTARNLNISIKKIEEGKEIFLEFERKEDRAFSILEKDPVSGKFIERIITGKDTTKEELEFNAWIAKTKEES